MKTVEEYYNDCKHLDWFYQYSDDNRVYQSGLFAHRKLENFAQDSQDPVFEKIYKAFRDYNFSGPNYGTERLPVPKLEDFI
jgi:hypothetical protein